MKEKLKKLIALLEKGGYSIYPAEGREGGRYLRLEKKQETLH